MRADARRNYERLLVAAKETFAERGADASLDEIARRANVGVGTLYRHFPTRQALLEDVVGDQLVALKQQAADLLEASDPAEALVAWLRAMMAHLTTFRGLAATLMIPMMEKGPTLSACYRDIHSAGDALLARAQEAGAIRSDVSVSELLKLVNGIAMSCENAANCSMQSERLFSLVMDGVRAPRAQDASAHQ
jgi:AcrR family transcriptional regulator